MTIISSSESRVFKIVVNVKVSNRVVEIKSFETISKAQKSKRRADSSRCQKKSCDFCPKIFARSDFFYRRKQTHPGKRLKY